MCFRLFPPSTIKVSNATGSSPVPVTSTLHSEIYMSPESFLAVPCGGSESHPDPVTFPEAFVVVFWERPIRHMTGDFHCKDGRQEVEWKPDLSAASLNVQLAARPSHCQQAQLGWALGWLVQWGLHVFVTAGVSHRRVPGCAWGTQAASVQPC